MKSWKEKMFKTNKITEWKLISCIWAIEEENRRVCSATVVERVRIDWKQIFNAPHMYRSLAITVFHLLLLSPSTALWNMLKIYLHSLFRVFICCGIYTFCRNTFCLFSSQQLYTHFKCSTQLHHSTYMIIINIIITFYWMKNFVEILFKQLDEFKLIFWNKNSALYWWEILTLNVLLSGYKFFKQIMITWSSHHCRIFRM